ncbi:MAG: ABC transporter permease [Cycloclasticus sp. symbiont of Bathymodiolus heckerae]|nr:MAG: ABC transporter permease [Cycloclasticus sp. symbiont of Bathymodiolus heckerae]
MKSQNLDHLSDDYRERYLALFLLVVVFLLFALSLNTGNISLNIIGGLSDILNGNYSIDSLIIYEIRLPRTLLAIIIGASLGLSGAALQGMVRNPLAEPGVIGVSSSAALGAVIVFYFGLRTAFPLALPLGGIIGALVAVVFLYALTANNNSMLTLILAGVAVSSLAAALTALALNLAPNPYASLEIFFWLMGSLSDRSFTHVWLIIPPTFLGWWLILSVRRDLDALSLGEDTAQSLGVQIQRLNKRIILGVALSVGAAVSVSGGIGFVGLVVPHILRPFVGYQPGRLLISSALGGALLLLAADIVVRLLPTQQELKIGVLTALLGAPFFLHLILKSKREWAS